MLALEDAYSDICQWSANNTNVNGIVTTTSISDAINDYNGQKNTNTILDSHDVKTNAPAAYYCSSYIFPNGEKGYLGSVGEWQAIVDNNIEIESILYDCGVETLSITYWTSTQYDSGNCWYFYGGGPTFKHDSKYGLFYVRAFCSL